MQREERVHEGAASPERAACVVVERGVAEGDVTGLRGEHEVAVAPFGFSDARRGGRERVVEDETQATAGHAAQRLGQRVETGGERGEVGVGERAAELDAGGSER